jgi:hypothetical protein
MCAGGGPPITVIYPTGGPMVCAGNLAQTTFTWALCSCSDMALSANFNTDAFNSAQGPYMPGGLGGGVGINGQLQSSQVTDVGGTLWCSGSTATGLGITASAPLTVGQDMHSGGPVTTGMSTVGTNAYINGNAKGGTLAITGTLYQSPGDTDTGVTDQSLVNNTAVTVPLPCACTQADIIPVANIVAARQTNNDNASIGLNPALFTNANPPQRLDLPCGNYYLNSLSINAPTTIVAHGQTALYIGGDIVNSIPLSLTLDPTAQLDIFVAGTITSSANLNIGSPNYPALTRTYVGSANPLSFSAGVSLAGNLYDAAALVKWSAQTVIYGAVFAGSFNASAGVQIHYDRQVVNVGQSCPGPGGSGGGPSCNTCRDCNNQACNGGKCGACTSSAQCCAPLLCISGTCQFAG